MSSDIIITDLINATWEDARRETDPERKAQLERDAAALEDVWGRSTYALAPTREQFQAALGNTTLNLSDTLSAVADGLHRLDTRVGEMHTHVQNNDTLVSTFVETFTPQFVAFQTEARAAWEASGLGLKKLDGDFRALNTRHGKQIRALASDIAAIKKVMANRPTERAAADLRLDQRLASMEQRLLDLEARGGNE